MSFGGKDLHGLVDGLDLKVREKEKSSSPGIST